MFGYPALLTNYMHLNNLVSSLAQDIGNKNNGQLCIDEITEKLGIAVEKMRKLHDVDDSHSRKKLLKELSLNLLKLHDKTLKRGELSTLHPKSNSELGGEALGRQTAIQATIVAPGRIRFRDVAGLTEVKRLLREAIVMPLKYPHLFKEGRKPWRKILLFGPPGTGKSRLARAVSSEVASTFYSVSCSDLLSSWFGETEKIIKDLFSHARKNVGRSIIFIDEIDGLCRRRNSNEQEQTRRIKTELLKQMEGSETQDESNLFVLGATNCPWELDTAFMRRFEKRIYIPLPDKQTRRELFSIHFQSVPVNMTNEEWERILVISEGYSGSDLSTCVADAMFEPVRELESSKFWKWNSDGKTVSPCRHNEEGAVQIGFDNIPAEQVTPRPVEYRDFQKAFQKNHKTVNVEELSSYEKFSNSGKID